MEFETVAELPAGARSKNTDAYDTLIHLKGSPSHHDQWIVVKRFHGEKAGDAAVSLASSLRTKYGPTNCEGFTFATREESPGSRTVYARFSPSLIEPGAVDIYRKLVAEKNAEAAAKAKAKAVKTAKANERKAG